MFSSPAVLPRRRRARSTPLASEAELRGARAPKQARSVALLQRVAAAARDLLTTRDYETVSVSDIASAAGVSVGALYTRFPSKEHLLVYLLGDVAEEIRERVRRRLRPERWERARLDEIVRMYLGDMADMFVTHRWILRPATMAARQIRDPALAAIVTAFNRDVHAQFRSLLLRRDDEIAHASPAAAIDVAILMISATMREVVLYGEPVSRLAPAQAQLIEELVCAATAYLTGAHPAP